MSKKSQNILIHILVWIQFVILPLIFFPKPFNVDHCSDEGGFLIGYIVTNLFFVIVFYLNYLYLVKSIYFKHKYFLYGGILFLIFLLSMLLGYYTKINHPIHISIHDEPHSPILGSIIIRLLIVLLTSFGLKVYERWRESEFEKSQMELSYLKAQINPHFLFNTLNGIYALALKKSDDAPTAIVKLSSIMRYVINDAKEEYVSLEKEMKYVADYVDLQKMRLNKNVEVVFVNEGEPIGKKIVPMLYISFIENAFKYGVSTGEMSEIYIKQSIFRNELFIEVINSICKTSIKEEDKTGIGLRNTKERLEKFYSGKYNLEIEESENRFRVELKLEVK